MSRPAPIVERVLAELAGHENPERAAFSEGYTPTHMILLGVAAKHLAGVARTIAREQRGAEPETVLDLARTLVHSGYFDLRQVGQELLKRHRAAFALLDAAQLEALGHGMDNWATVDHFTVNLVGKAWMKGQIGDARIALWGRSEDRWWRRAAIVATVPLNIRSRGGTGDAARTLVVCERHVADPDDMIVKALSWALRSLAPWDPAAVATFLERHEGTLAKRVLREVRHKLRTGKKS